ncbi:protein DMP6-like [Phragmites australis]|uniref:protein DMP6-like n=1 Tax=Phragmites australis TaxID=29695 RepID=UPI002D77C528|nr:protein DMP6-like [Phragmites australis]
MLQYRSLSKRRSMQGGGEGSVAMAAAAAAAEARHDDVEALHEHDDDSREQKRPLLAKRSVTADDGSDGMSPIQRAISQTYQSTAHLAKLLPTGTVLAFQLLTPIVTAQGRCIRANRAMASALVALCALSCFVLSFTDSFRDAKGAVRYGFATFRGLWAIDGGAPLDPQAAAGYKIRFLDFVHAVVSVMVFAAVALFDRNVVSCFYPVPSEDVRQVLTVLPIAIGVVGSMLFVSFPTTRHGIGFPLSAH